MRKSIKNFVIGAVMAATALTASTAAFAGQYVQTDMNFRSGASKTCASIGSVPAGAEVEVLGSTNGWDLVKYNGQIGYIHGGNLGNSYVARPQQAQPQQQSVSNSTRDYFDNNWTGTAANMNANADVNTASSTMATRLRSREPELQEAMYTYTARSTAAAVGSMQDSCSE